MSDKPKTSYDIQAYLNSLDNQGYLNDWEPDPDEFATSITTAATDTNKTFQNVDSIIRKQKDRLTNNPNRKAIVCGVKPLSTWEETVLSFGETKNKNSATETPVKKALTRNAESKDYFTNAPWEYSNSPMGIYEKSIVEALQTKIILTNPEINIQPGAIVSQIYGSNSQKEALLLDKITEGFGEFPSIVSSEQFFVERGGSFFMEAPDNTPGTINTTGNTLSNIESVFPPGKLVQQVLDSGWSPVYNPCAIPKGGKRPTVNVGKSRLEFGLQGERSDFGPRTHPTDPGLLQFHEGQDMSAGPAYPIVAVASGEITIIKMDKTRDKKGSETQRQPKSKEMCYITIKHDTNEVLRNEKIEVHTTYMHLLRIADSNSVGRRLQVGDRVTAGQAIALTGGGKGWPGSGRTAGVHLHFEIGVRKAKSGGGFDYDEYEAESKDQKGVNPGDKPRTAMYSGDKKRGGAMRLGCVDPLHFKYPNLNSFSNDAETRDLIKSFIPITIRERAEKEKSAEEKAAKDAEFAKTKKRVITAAGLVSPVLTVIGAVGGGQVYATKAAVDYISAPIPDEEDTGFTITASPEETE